MNKEERTSALLAQLLEEFGYKELAQECKSPKERQELEKEMEIFTRQIMNVIKGRVENFEIDQISLPKLWALNNKKLEQGVIKYGEIYKVNKY